MISCHCFTASREELNGLHAGGGNVVVNFLSQVVFVFVFVLEYGNVC